MGGLFSRLAFALTEPEVMVTKQLKTPFVKIVIVSTSLHQDTFAVSSPSVHPSLDVYSLFLVVRFEAFQVP